MALRCPAVYRATDPKSPTIHLWEAHAIRDLSGSWRGAGKKDHHHRQPVHGRTHALRASLDLWKRWCSGMRNARSLSVLRSLQVIDRARACRLHGSQYDLTAVYHVQFYMHCMCDLVRMLNMQCLNKTGGDTGGCLWDAFEHMECRGHCSVIRFSTADSAKLPCFPWSMARSFPLIRPVRSLSRALCPISLTFAFIWMKCALNASTILMRMPDIGDVCVWL